MSTQLSVQEILTNFEDKRSTTQAGAFKPFIKPRKNKSDLSNSKEELKDKGKPIPLPRPLLNQNVNKELNEKLKTNKPSDVTQEKNKSPPVVSPKPQQFSQAKAGPVKPIMPKPNTPSNDGLSDSQSATELRIAFTVAGAAVDDSPKPIEAHNQMYNELADNIISTNKDNISNTTEVTSVSEKVEKTLTAIVTDVPKRTATKQRSTKVQKAESDVAYAVVTLQEPPPQTLAVSKNELELHLTNNTDNYELVYSQPDDIASPMTPTSPNVYLEPTNVMSGCDDVDGESKSGTSTREKGKRYKKKTPISKSMAHKKTPMSAEDLKRRQSLPEFHNQRETNRIPVHEYEDISLNTCTPPSDITSPAGSDDECWNSDEFESSSADEEEEVFTEQPIPKLVGATVYPFSVRIFP